MILLLYVQIVFNLSNSPGPASHEDLNGLSNIYRYIVSPRRHQLSFPSNFSGIRDIIDNGSALRIFYIRQNQSSSFYHQSIIPVFHQQR